MTLQLPHWSLKMAPLLHIWAFEAANKDTLWGRISSQLPITAGQCWVDSGICGPLLRPVNPQHYPFPFEWIQLPLWMNPQHYPIEWIYTANLPHHLIESTYYSLLFIVCCVFEQRWVNVLTRCGSRESHFQRSSYRQGKKKEYTLKILGNGTLLSGNLLKGELCMH